MLVVKFALTVLFNLRLGDVMGEKNSKYIYVLFIKAHTLLGKCARVLTDCD